VAKDAVEAEEMARRILGMKLVTHQTGPEGRIVQRLLVEETLPIERELYLGIVLDRPTCPACARAEPLCNCQILPRPTVAAGRVAVYGGRK